MSSTLNHSSKPGLTSTPSEGGKNRSPSRIGATPNSSSPLNRTWSNRIPPTAAVAGRGAGRKQGSREEDMRPESTSLTDDLRNQLRKIESASEEYQKQLVVLQSRLDEALAEQIKLEEGAAHHRETISNMESELQETHRARNELQTTLDMEQTAFNGEREAATTREVEMNEVISRLKESLAQRESRKSMSLEGSLSRAASFRGRSSPNPEASPGRRDSSQNNSQLLLQKDKVIEDLRLELAEAHVKVMEVDRAGGGRLQHLEKQLLEVRMSNAKLMEDNESYQYLLQEKTISGDMTRKFTPLSAGDPSDLSRAPSRDLGSGTLADELETVGEEDEPDDAVKRLEKELHSQKDQNKALTLYINRIIGRLLENDKFEQLFENDVGADQTSPRTTATKAPAPAPAPPLAPALIEKDLPLPPTAEEDPAKENIAGGSLLSRAGSIFGSRKQRPRSYQPPRSDEAAPAMPRPSIDHTIDEQDAFHARPILGSISNEDPNTAPRVPLNRGSSTRVGGSRAHRRTTSDVSASALGSTVRGHSPLGGRAFSPPLSNPKRYSATPQSPPRTAVGGGGLITFEQGGMSYEMAMDDTGELPMRSVRTASDSGYGDSIETTSSPPPTSLASSSVEAPRQSGSGAIVPGGKQMRPLRLVQEKVEADEEKKRANRGSWMGWFNKGPQQQAPATLAPAGQAGAFGGQQASGPK